MKKDHADQIQKCFTILVKKNVHQNVIHHVIAENTLKYGIMFLWNSTKIVMDIEN